MSKQEKTFLFNDRCVLGTAGLGGVWGKVRASESIQCILHALECGCTLIDTSPSYGNAEMYIGTALMKWRGKIPSISTKAGRLKSFASDEGIYDYSDEGLENSVTNSLNTLNIPCINILFLHDPSAIPAQDLPRVIEKMLSFKKRGMVAKIGLGGNYPALFEPYLSSGVFDVVMCYNRLNACCVDDLDTTLPFCLEKNIAYYLASPLHMGLLGSSFQKFSERKPDWLSKEMIVQANVIKHIADKHKIGLSSLAHRFLLGFDLPFKIVIGAANQMQLNSTIGDFQQGPLPHDIQTEILYSLQDKVNG
ncbi:aldo/keto reductase [Danxiaibacter flavus]|uniref:Aldo/keto reductase n=1 Tax=Danxiaibacter flavus TaxID=3049108 RepID=A0ABV3ZK92_9BACT|nr:aldo/keto reductase [Chitinophagaceae bacterium DXS]